jgi:hypothetical protein
MNFPDGAKRTLFTGRIIVPSVLFLLLYAISAEPNPAGILFAKNGRLFDGKSASYFSGRELINDLQSKTGLRSIGIDEMGRLIYDRSEKPSGGSEKMRRLILGAIDDPRNFFQISDYPDAAGLHFGRIDEGTVDLETGKVCYDVGFDFTDFTDAAGFSPPEVLASFSPGIVLFHEIDHKVSYDPAGPIPAGKVRPDKSTENIRGVIENTNIVRKELGLILRDAETAAGELSGGDTRFFYRTIRIPFFDRSGGRVYLRWKLKENPRPAAFSGVNDCAV